MKSRDANRDCKSMETRLHNFEKSDCSPAFKPCVLWTVFTKQQSLRLRPQLVSNNLLYYKIESVWLVWLTIFANIAANWKHLNRKSLSLYRFETAGVLKFNLVFSVKMRRNSFFKRFGVQIIWWDRPDNIPISNFQAFAWKTNGFDGHHGRARGCIRFAGKIRGCRSRCSKAFGQFRIGISDRVLGCDMQTEFRVARLARVFLK